MAGETVIEELLGGVRGGGRRATDGGEDGLRLVPEDAVFSNAAAQRAADGLLLKLNCLGCFCIVDKDLGAGQPGGLWKSGPTSRCLTNAGSGSIPYRNRYR